MTRSMKCENCGGSISYDPNNPISFCPYCATAVKRSETSMDALRLKLRHEEEVRQRKEQEKIEKEKRKKKDEITTTIEIFVIWGLMFLFIKLFVH